MPVPNRYAQILSRIFLSRHRAGDAEVAFEREDMERAAQELGIKLPKNLGDVVYSFRYRVSLPPEIQALAPEDKAWIIRPAGRSRYPFVAVENRPLTASPLMAETKIPDATPGLIARYALNDEQGRLAKLRYNRLIDVFTGIACYSLQNHLRATVPGIGQVETDEIYVGVDSRGAQYVLPVQAKGGKDRLSIVQIEQDYALCANKFPMLLCRPIAAQFLANDLVALFAFEESENGLAITRETHYRLVPAEDVSAADLETYRNRPF